MQFPNLLFSDCCRPSSGGSIEQARQFILSQQQQQQQQQQLQRQQEDGSSSSSNNNNNNNDNVDIVVSTAFYPESLEFHEIRQVVGAAFGGKTVEQGNDIMMYTLKPLDLDTQQRQDVSGFCMGFFAYELLYGKNGLAFGLRDKKSGQVKGVVVFREYQPAKENQKPGVLAKITDFITMMKAYFKMKSDPIGVPTILQNDKTKRKKFGEASQAIQPMQEMMHNWHCQYAPNPEPHWYVGLVATDPDCHGKGYGKKLMSILNEAADECGMACYLETPHVNQTFYEKMGYQTTKPVTMNFTSELLGDLADHGYLMTRYPK